MSYLLLDMKEIASRWTRKPLVPRSKTPHATSRVIQDIVVDSSDILDSLWYIICYL
jgi:hypothetical protein